MAFDQQRDFYDIIHAPTGRVQRGDQILKRAVNLGLEVVGTAISNTDLTGDVNDIRVRCSDRRLRITILSCIREMIPGLTAVFRSSAIASVGPARTIVVHSVNKNVGMFMVVSFCK